MTDLTREQLRKMHLVRVEGQLVERDALNIAEKINAYDSNLYLQVLNASDCISDPPFRVLERCKDGIDRVAFTAWTLDDRLMQRIYSADTNKFQVGEEAEKHNERLRNEDRRRYQEKQEALNELAVGVLKSPKDTYKANHPETGELLTFKA